MDAICFQSIEPEPTECCLSQAGYDEGFLGILSQPVLTAALVVYGMSENFQNIPAISSSYWTPHG